MKRNNFIFALLIASKNRAIKREREKIRALEETQKILACYVALLVAKSGETRIPKSFISEGIGKYTVEAGSDGENYVLRVRAKESKNSSPAEKKIAFCQFSSAADNEETRNGGGEV